jgi:hypothetical protein
MKYIIMGFFSFCILTGCGKVKYAASSSCSPSNIRYTALPDGRSTVVSSNGFVPDEATAIRIAEAVLEPVYGKKKIRGERPFHGTLSNGVWTVRGSLPKNFPPLFIVFGGVAEIDIAKEDGRILRIVHGK